MRWLFRWAFRLVILLIVLIVAGVLLLDPVVREIAEYRLSRQTGLEVKIGKVNIGLLNPRIGVENLVIYNSAEFGGSPLLNLPELDLEYDAGALWSHQLHYRLVRVNLAGGSVVEDKKGRLNLEVLQAHLKPVGGGGGVSGTNNHHGADYKFLGIDALNLTLGKVDFYSMKNPAHVDTLTLDVRNQVLTNIKTADNLVPLYDWILLRNSAAFNANNDPNNPWQYWRAKLEALGKK